MKLGCRPTRTCGRRSRKPSTRASGSCFLASEEGAQSDWVNKEISHWLATKAVDHILPVVTDGTWDWDPDHQ